MTLPFHVEVQYPVRDGFRSPVNGDQNANFHAIKLSLALVCSLMCQRAFDCLYFPKYRPREVSPPKFTS